jgi:hypothetical protein
MTQSFEEFWKSCKKGFFRLSSRNKFTIGQWVFLNTCIGEMAWDTINQSVWFEEEKSHMLEYFSMSKKKRKKVEKEAPPEAFEADSNLSTWTIAIACLGEKEIKRRLKK